MGPTREERRATWDWYREHFPLGPDTISTKWGPITPSTVSEFHPDPARRVLVYTGTGEPSWLNHSPVPLFLSAARLSRYRNRGDDFPVNMYGGESWAGDSGAYAAFMLVKDPAKSPWWWHPDEYGSFWVRMQLDLGPPNFVAIQDWPCELDVRKRTGLTVLDHQRLTLESYLYLTENFPMIQWLPVLQGWAPWEYLRHYEMYGEAGVELERVRYFGVGSICRRGSQRSVAAVFQALAALHLRLHAFGASINALRLIGHLLYSADSQAWSTTARNENIRLDGCTHMSRPDRVTGLQVPTDCRNCFRYALTYREEIMQALRDGERRREGGEQLELTLV